MAKKNGPLTKEETEYINENKSLMSVEEIAKKLQRRPSTISDYIINNFGASQLNTSAPIKSILKKEPFYEELKSQFSAEELKMFEYHYTNMNSQFQDDVFHTEKGQIIDLCKLEILMGRCLIRQRKNMEEQTTLERELAQEREAGENADHDRINHLLQLIAQLGAASNNMQREYKELLERKTTCLRDIKGTRAELRKNLEESNKENFGTLLTRLAMDGEYRRKVGIEIETYRLAMKKEYERLAQEVLYADGVYDRPILNSETVMFDEEKKKV